MTLSLEKHHLCKVTLLGNLVAKPEIRYSANPVVAIAEVTIATHSKWYDKKSQEYKEWTSYHTVKVIGDYVEQAILYANKGDIMLIHGYLLNSRKTNREIIHADFAQVFDKGYAQSINTIQISGQLLSPIKLLTTEQNKQFAQGTIEISHQYYSKNSKQFIDYKLSRPFHVWGKQALYLSEHAKSDDNLIIEGQLSYLKNAQKSQFIEAQQCILITKKGS